MNALCEQAYQLNEVLLKMALMAIKENRASQETARLVTAWHKANRRLNRRYFKQSEVNYE